MLTLLFKILTQLCFNENEADVEIITLLKKRILVSELAESQEVFPQKINERILRQ